MTSSRIPRFYQLSVEERLRELRDRGILTEGDYESLSTGSYILTAMKADRLTENVIGVSTSRSTAGTTSYRWSSRSRRSSPR